MQRSRLKNIINKSKEISNKSVGDPFDEFKKSLPKLVEVGDNYRLEAAWKAYGSPKDYKHALWLGMICPVDEDTYKLPSIGYNEDTDEYEYLNKGRENDIVAKDIRVWDNDVIPLVKELKLGGYVRKFNELKDCWIYTKNIQKEKDTLDLNQINILKEPSGEQIDYLKDGNKLEQDVPKDLFELIDGDYYYWPDDDRALEWLKNNKWFRKQYKQWGDPEDGQKARLVTKKKLEDLWYEKNKEQIFKSLRTTGLPSNWTPVEGKTAPDGLTLYEDENGETYTLYPVQYNKNGGQMTVIPEGALHARKNNMEGAGEDFTAKGIPVVDNKGEQQAEIERNEIIFRKEVTDKIEELFKKYKEEDSNTKKDEIAIEMGKILTCEITKHTDDKTGLIEEILNKNT